MGREEKGREEIEAAHADLSSLAPHERLPEPWTAAYQAPPSMGFSRQVYWSVESQDALPLATRMET